MKNIPKFCKGFGLESPFSNNAINNGLACSILFLSTPGVFPVRRKILEHETQSSNGVIDLALGLTKSNWSLVMLTVNLATVIYL